MALSVDKVQKARQAIEYKFVILIHTHIHTHTCTSGLVQIGAQWGETIKILLQSQDSAGDIHCSSAHHSERSARERERERERVLVGPFSLLCELFFFVSQWVLRLECWRKQQYWCSPVPKFENNTDIKQERSMCYQLNVHVVNHNVFLIMPWWAEPRGIR